MRLIDADALIICIVKKYGLTKIILDVDESPTIDAEPIRYGHWVVDEDGNIKCSECGHHSVGDNYCERCGAKMENTA